MNCEVCDDKGIVKVNWTDAPEDFAVCLCRIGMDMRSTRNYRSTAAPLWQVWACREQIDPEKMLMLENVLTEAEMQLFGFAPAAAAAPLDREAALLAAGKTRKGKL